MKQLTSLALLLLALCRSSTGEISWSNVDHYASTHKRNESIPFSIPQEAKIEQYQKFVLGNLSKTQIHDLNEQLGNTIYAMILDRLGMYENLPAYYRQALDNGVLCEVDQRLSTGAVRSIQYHSDKKTIQQRLKEHYTSSNDSAIDINCSKTDDPCFCREEGLLLYCIARNFKTRVKKTGVTRKMCVNELLESIEEDDAAMIEGFYLDDSAYEYFIQYFNDPRAEWEEDELLEQAALRYCRVVETTAQSSVKTLFAANALRWTLEGYIIEALFNRTHKNIDEACRAIKFATSEVGQCACANKDTGVAFCAHKARAHYFKKIGYLNCTGDTPRFEEATRPETIPPFACHADAVAAASSDECEVYRASIGMQ